MGVLRWRSRLDDEIQQASSQPLAKLDLEVLIALRLGLYQFRWLDRVPQRAALHESVELVKSARKRSAAPFVNAVLRKLSATRQNPSSEAKHFSAEELASTYAHPLWMVERWARQYELAAARRICIQDQSPAPTSVRIRDENFTAGEVTLAPGSLLASARRVLSGDITKTAAFRDGQIAIQDEASQLVAALVSPQAPEHASRILDCCAAPGGKTAAIADNNPGRIDHGRRASPPSHTPDEKTAAPDFWAGTNSNRRRRCSPPSTLCFVRPSSNRCALFRHGYACPQS